MRSLRSGRGVSFRGFSSDGDEEGVVRIELSDLGLAGDVGYPILLFWHMDRISKVLSEIDPSDSVYFYAQAVRLYYMVRALEAFLSPYLSNEYFDEKKRLSRELRDGSAYVEYSLSLLELLIGEMARLNILMRREVSDVDDVA